ncbi:MAG: hypothetical protein OEL80_02345 [Desulfuromonadales bacterium]|nr:hypothetical protein [Desulfuromonadales bacterium]
MAVWLVTIIAVFAGSILYNQYQSTEYDAMAGPYIRKIIPEISKWDPATTRALMAPEVSATMPEEDFTRALALFSKLGVLQSMAEPKFDQVHQDLQTDIGKQTIVVYDIEAKYENGDAVINLKLLDKGDALQIYRFGVSSEILAE